MCSLITREVDWSVFIVRYSSLQQIIKLTTHLIESFAVLCDDILIRFFENSIQLVEAAPKPQQNTQPNTGSQSSNNQGGESANNSQNNASQGSSSSNNSQGVTSNNSSSTSANSSSNNSNTSAQSSDSENADESTDASEQDEQTAEEQEQNPDTSDSFPILYVLLLLAAIFVLVKNKNILKN